MGDGTGGGAPDKSGSGTEESGGVSTLVAVLGLIAPLATAIGALALTGTVGRIQRNAEVETAFAFILVVVASGCWGIGLLVGERWSKLLRGLAIGLTAAGTVFALLAAITTAHRQSRPQIQASFDEKKSMLTATVTASGLPIDDRLAIEVDGLVWKSRNEVPAPTKPQLYQAYVGADQDGHISQTVSVAVPKGYNAVGVKAYTGGKSPHCNDFGDAIASTESGTGCVIISVAQP
jgi:hypothetical protein